MQKDIPEKSVPKEISITLPRIGALALMAVLFALIWALFVSPNSYARPLDTAMRAIKGMAGVAGSAPPYANFEIEPIRNTAGSLWAHDIAMLTNSGERAQGMGAHSSAYHGPGVIMAMQKGFSGLHDKCTIRVSAQAFDFDGTPYSALLSRIGSREDGFVIVLAHELGHCYWNPGLAYENRMDKVQGDAVLAKEMVSLMPLVLNIAESYGDAYALVFAARVDQNFFARAYEGIATFRGNKQVKSDVHKTVHALQAAAQMTPTLPSKSSALHVRWDITNRYVMSAALTGAMRWRMDQGVSRETAISDISFVLQEQGIEFDLKIIDGKEYLIVSKASDGLENKTNPKEF